VTAALAGTRLPARVNPPEGKRKKVVFSAWSAHFYFSCSYAKRVLAQQGTEWGQELVAEDPGFM